jgi:hypothetical protein
MGWEENMKNFYTVPDKASTDVFIESLWNQNIRDNLNNKITPPMAKIQQVGNLTLTTAVVTTIPLALVLFDTDEMATSFSYLDVNTAGMYLLGGEASFAPSTTGYRLINCSGFANQHAIRPGINQPDFCNMPPTSNGASTGTKITFVGYQSSGGNLVISLANEWAIWVGRTS